MDGLQARLSNSLQFQLSAWLSGVVLLLAAGAGAFAFWTSFEEANELQDDQLRQVASMFDLYDLPIKPPRLAGVPDAAMEPDLQIAVRIIGAAGPQRGGGQVGDLSLSADISNGLHTVAVRGESWRVLVRPLQSGQRLAVGQQTAARDEIARTSALRTILPLLALVPLVVVLVSFVVRRRLRPVARLAQVLDRRTEHDSAPLPSLAVPNEIVPFATAIDRLLARLVTAMEAQRRFVADAAHELRSPLTALSLQAEGLAQVDLTTHARGKLDKLRDGVRRARALLDQLLTLAKSHQHSPEEAIPVSASSVLKQVLEDLMPYAESREVDLGVEQNDDATLKVHEVELSTVMRNLIDNAIRYSTPGGRIDIRLQRDGGGVLFEVADDGPGIAPFQRERVFDPFYRVLGTDTDGSGLGLSIVKTLVERVGGSVSLHDADRGTVQRGLRVVVRLPVVSTGQTDRERASPR